MRRRPQSAALRRLAAGWPTASSGLASTKHVARVQPERDIPHLGGPPLGPRLALLNRVPRPLPGAAELWRALTERTAHDYVQELDVQGNWRRQGVGSALIAEAMALARRLGSTRFWLSTGRHNETAQALYESLGGDRKPLGDVNYWWDLD